MQGGADQPAVLEAGRQVQVIGPPALSDRVKRHISRRWCKAQACGFRWLFGDGTDAYGARVQHRFPDSDGTLYDGSGRFRVLLEVTSPANRHTWVSTPVVVAQALQPALPPSGSIPGIAYTYSPADASVEPTSGVADTVSLRAIPPGASNYTHSFEGLLDVPVDGGYTFQLSANEAASIELDGRRIASSRAPIAQVCGLLGMAAQSLQGSAALAKGKHLLRVVDSHGIGRDDLRLLWQGPGQPLGPVSATAFSH